MRRVLPNPMNHELYLYGELSATSLDLPRVRAFLEALLPLNIHLRGGFSHYKDGSLRLPHAPGLKPAPPRNRMSPAV